MNRENHDLIPKMNIKSDAVVVNQGLDFNRKVIEKNNFKVLWLDVDEKGLSKSRNMAVENSWGDICLIADDDLVYEDLVDLIVVNEFKKNPNADIIAFQVERTGALKKNFYPKARKLNFLTSMRVSSVEIAFKTKSINDHKIKFVENFGAGAKYSMGEENIFLFDCLRKGLNIYYVPIKIASLDNKRASSWFVGFNEKFFRDQGAVFTRMSKTFSYLLIFQYAIRKRKLYLKTISMKTAIIKMLEGRKEFLRETKA